MATTTYDTTRGIAINGITKMQNAIKKYKREVDSACDAALNFSGYKSMVNNAIKGTNAQKKLESEMNKIKDYQASLVRELDRFSSKLDNIKSQYVSQDSKFTFKSPQ